MDITTVITAVRDLQTKLENADVYRQKSNIYLWGDGLSAIRFELEYSSVPEYGSGYETFVRNLTHDDIASGIDVGAWLTETLIEAHAWIDAIPTADERAHQAFTKSLGRLIDQGRDIGIEVDFLNPLTAMMEKLATNALEDKRNS